MGRRLVILGFLLMLSFGALAQRNVNNMSVALDLFEKQQYSAAQQAFKNIAINGSNISQRTEADFYQLLCGVYLQQPGSIKDMDEWLLSHPTHPLAQVAALQMGRAYYAMGDYKTSDESFRKVRVKSLGAKETDDYWFESSHAALMVEDYERAKEGFSHLVNKNTRYRVASNYFTAHIDYVLHNYDIALSRFQTIENDEQFGAISSFYISLVYYAMERYNDVLAYAIPRISIMSADRAKTAKKIIGISYFMVGKFADALPYLEEYVINNDSDNQDKYYLGLTYYRLGRYDEALGIMQKITKTDDDFGQNVRYHLGDLYQKAGDKENAAQLFLEASQMNFSPQIQEDALFNYSVMAYELGYLQFEEASNVFSDYLNKYPDSSRNQELYRYLADSYLNSKEYESAWNVINRIEVKDAELEAATQKIAFFLGLNYFNDSDFEKASNMFDESLKYASNDKSLAARATYWKGESLYRKGNYDEALNCFAKFKYMDGASDLDEYKDSFYTSGYALFHQEKYSEALAQFNNYVSMVRTIGGNLYADGLNRLADCQYMLQKYSEAAANYSLSAKNGLSNPDYALFQQAFCYGLLRMQDSKIETLSQLRNKYPNSEHMPAAIYETGRAYVTSNRPSEAISQYEYLISHYNNSSYVSKSYLELALIAFNDNRNDEAINLYKKVVTMFPNTDDAKSALMGLRNVYGSMNQGETYLEYMMALGGDMGNISVEEQEDISFQSAQNLYMSKDYAKAIPTLERHIERFPNGDYILNAKFYLADCNHAVGDDNKALLLYEQVASQQSIFTENALLNAANMRFAIENWSEALNWYTQLSQTAEIADNATYSNIGMMRCYYQLQQYSQAANMASVVLSKAGLSAEVTKEAGYIRGKSLQAIEQYDEAIVAYRKVAADINSVEGAESEYRIIEILYQQRKLDEAQKEVFDFTSKNSVNQYWLAMSFMTLSDIYIIKGDTFQATSTLQSIIDNYFSDEDGIKNMAKEKKTALELLQQ